MVGMGLVGFLDDYIKIVKRRSLGLRAKAKMAGQLIVGIAFAVLALQFSDNRGNTPASTKLSFITDFGWTIGPVLFVIWALFMILAMSNGVNLTDGLDGLATGASVLVFGAYTFIGVWQFQESCANAMTLTNPNACYEVRDPLDLAVVASALMGACLGFLWWNTSRPRSSWATPARSRSAVCSRAWRSAPAPSCCSRCWAASSCSSPCRWSSRSLLPAHRQACLPDGATAAPLRTQGLVRSARRGPFLDHPGHLCHRRTGPLLRGMAADK